MPARLLQNAGLGQLPLQAKREFVQGQIEAHRNGGLICFSKTY